MALAASPSRTAAPAIPASAGTHATSIDVLLMALVLLVAGVPLLTRALAQGATPPVAPELHLQVGQGGVFRLDGRALDRAQLDHALRQARAGSPDLRLLIATADDSDYHGIVGALAAAEHAGVRNVGSEVR
jgi:biopolymer transport protein ExbD